MLRKAIRAEVDVITAMLRHERRVRGDLTPALAEKFDSLAEWAVHLCKRDRGELARLITELQALWVLRYFKRQYLLSPCRRPLFASLTPAPTPVSSWM